MPSRSADTQASHPQGDGKMFSTFAALTAIVVFLLATAGIVAVSTKSDTTVTASAPVAVTLSEFKINPSPITASAGQVQLAVTNSGSMAHNLSVPSLNKKTRDISAGQSQTLDLGTLEPGTYDVLCEIPGHADSGMKAQLIVTAGGDTATASGDMAGMDMGSTDTTMDYAAMSRAMQDSFKPYPAATEGIGNTPLVPTVDADGTKVFNLTAAIGDWEVEPGKVVQAWTYNGTAPGPWIKVDIGDKVRVNITNDLPGGTDIHFHGIDTPFTMDGVAPITQEIIPENGGTYSYEFTVDHYMMGMYHAHNMGDIAVPNGMFGVFQVGDTPLPAGRTISGITIPQNIQISQEIPMVLNDAGVIGLSLNGKSFPATAPIVAKSGDWIEMTYFNEGFQMHTMHLHKFPQLVVAKDGFPLDQPYAADTIAVGPGERYTVLVNPDEAGTWVWHCHILNHVERDTGMFGMVTALVVQ